MKILLTGATGMIGSAALIEALAHNRVETVTVLSRKPLKIQDPKLRVIVREDFENYADIMNDLEGHDACFWCLGVYQADVTAEEYRRITHDYVLAAATAMAEANPRFVFCFLSAQGADSFEKSPILDSRVRGETENALLKLGHPEVYCFRPAYVYGDSKRPRTKVETFFIRPFAPLLHRVAPNFMIRAPELGRAMIQVVRKGFPRPILENIDIREAAAAGL